MKMKLSDLQTNQYLELEKHFYYGRGRIFLTGTFDGSIFIDKIRVEGFIRIRPHTNPIINQIAEEIGGVIYGGRYVLLSEDNNGDIFCEKTNFGTVYYISKNQYRFLPVKDFNEKNDINSTVSRFFTLNKEPQNKIANIFEEFAKKEQGLKNKFDELYNLIYGKK